MTHAGGLGGVVLAAFMAAFAAPPAAANDLNIAVAANFAAPAEAIALAFEAETGIHVAVSSGSSGALYAQIAQGAPFSVFLSADAERPQNLEVEGVAVAGSRFTYALGTLVLWSPDAGLVDGEGEVLKSDRFAHLALANAATAPYGAAAIEVLDGFGLTEALSDRIVTGESIAQTFQFVKSGNAELGFVALSQLVGEEGGSRWVVPETLYAPIRQDAVLLDGANPDASAFISFLKSTKSREIVAQFGYGQGDQ